MLWVLDLRQKKSVRFFFLRNLQKKVHTTYSLKQKNTRLALFFLHDLHQKTVHTTYIQKECQKTKINAPNSSLF